jgi:cytochrome bd-type quinol oxidase subunit 2
VRRGTRFPVSAPHAGAAYLHTSSAYGPAFSLLSKPTALVDSPDVAAWIFKSTAALCVLAATWLVARRRAFAAARETSYAIPHRLHVSPWVFAAAYAVAYAWLLRQAQRGRARSGLALALLLVALPYLTAWYILWPLALSARDDDRTAIVITLALCAYLLPQRIPM